MKSKSIFILFFLSLPIFVFGRFMELFLMIDPSTGFFYEDFSEFYIFFTILFGAVGGLLLFLTFLGKNYPDTLRNRSPILGSFSILFSLIFLIESAKMISDGKLFHRIEEGSSAFVPGNFIYFILLILCAVSFCFFAVQNFTEYRINKILMAFPILLWIYRLIYVFISYTGMANISENVIEMLMICASLLFFLAHGKIIGGIDHQKNMRAATGFGILSALLCSLSTIPRYILFFIGKADLIHEKIYGSLIDLFFIFYSICFLMVQLKKDKQRKF